MKQLLRHVGRDHMNQRTLLVVLQKSTDVLLWKSNFFLESFERGLSVAVSGDTPNSLLVDLALFNGALTRSKVDL